MSPLYVALAGAAGVLARYYLSSAVHGGALLWMTAAINVVGSFLLGLLVVAHGTSAELRTVLGVGFLGGFTTFSTFSVQAWLDLEAGTTGRAFAYVCVSVVAGVLAAAAGYRLGRAVF